MLPILISIGLRNSKINEVELVHLRKLRFEVSDHDVVWLDVTVNVAFVVHPLNQVDKTNTNAHDSFGAKMLLVSSDKIIDGETQLL